ncbi:MAG: cation:proton antiporter [Sphingobacteriaceae bacterium]
MNLYIIMLTIVGLASLLMAWMPAISKKTGISYAIWYVLAGFILYSSFDFFPNPDPIRKEDFVVHLTELVVVVSLMGSGLKIDERFSFKRWAVPFRLVTSTMLLSIVLLAFGGVYLLHFDIASAILLGAVLAPTDPVLASDVQVGPPHDKEKNIVRFGLTAEAGMNDGMAFPFTWLAVTVALLGSKSGGLKDWVWMDLLYRTFVGVASGFLIGRILAWLLFYLPKKMDFEEIRDGFVAVSATLVAYGITELFNGYGFIAVFVTAITIRNYEMNHRYHTKLHSFIDQIERILLAIVLLLFGGSLATGILANLTLKMAILGLLFLFLIRPFSAWIGLLGTRLNLKEKAAIGFFGIRGVGSFFYLAFALDKSDFSFADELWSIAAFVVLVSIITHGTTAAFGMKKIEESYSEEPEK